MQHCPICTHTPLWQRPSSPPQNQDNMKRARLVLQLGDEEDVTLIVSGRHDVFGLEGSRGVVIPLSVFLSDSPGVVRARVKSFCETP